MVAVPRGSKTTPEAIQADIERECQAIARFHGAGPAVLPSAVTVFVPEAEIRTYLADNRSRVIKSAPSSVDNGYFVTVAR